jgi:uncharacterized protein YcaQ
MTATPVELSADEARRMALAAQGFTDRRPTGRVDRRHLRRVLDRIGLIQIDSVNVLVRSQELPLFARLGPHPRSMIADATRDGELFEYWAHMASHVPSDQHRLFRWRMESVRTRGWRIIREMAERRDGFVDGVLARIRDEGPVVAADISVREGRKGPWWDWDDAKTALEFLFETGQLAVTRRARDFARVYDLPERVLPAAVLSAPAPTEHDARKELLERAARAQGVATLADLADYYRLNVPKSRPMVAELVEEGRLIPARVEGWKQGAYLHPEARIPRRVAGQALLSPFDSLVWTRDRTERVFGFRYRIEIYTPPPKRVYGYFVLPFLLDGHFVGRVDLKADRAAGTLVVQAAHAEPGVDTTEVAAALAAELESMATWLGLDGVVSAGRGDLAPALGGVLPVAPGAT